MRKVAILSTAVLLVSSVAAACGEHVTRSEKTVQEKSTYSSTVQDNREPTLEQRHDSSTLEQRHETTTSDGMGGNMSTHENSTVEKSRSETTSPSSDEDSLGSAQEYHQQSETFHQHTRTEVTK